MPAVRFWGDDPSWFGVPFLVVERVPGATPGDLWDRDWHMPAELAGEGRSLTSPAIEALAAIHRVDWETALGDWDRPRSSSTEIERCSRLLERSAPMPWNADARRLGERLLDPPADPAPAWSTRTSTRTTGPSTTETWPRSSIGRAVSSAHVRWTSAGSA